MMNVMFYLISAMRFYIFDCEPFYCITDADARAFLVCKREL